MKTTQPIHADQMREIQVLALRAELMLERLERKLRYALQGNSLAKPLTTEELSVVGHHLNEMLERWNELTDRVVLGEASDSRKPEAQTA